MEKKGGLKSALCGSGNACCFDGKRLALRCDASGAREGFYGILDGEHILRSLGPDKR
jgi:hypothetical protein